MVSKLCQLGISNVPVDPLNNTLFWEHLVKISKSLYNEQQFVLSKIRDALTRKFAEKKTTSIE